VCVKSTVAILDKEFGGMVRDVGVQLKKVKASELLGPAFFQARFGETLTVVRLGNVIADAGWFITCTH
jgi:hypothetical protein